jgi:hypothetical protein
MPILAISQVIVLARNGGGPSLTATHFHALSGEAMSNIPQSAARSIGFPITCRLTDPA